MPGKPEESLLYDYISTDEMPPDKPLSAVEVDIFKRWITEGAYYPKKQLDIFDATTESRAGRDWWSFQPIKKSSPPASPAGKELTSAVDRFIVASLREQGLSLSPTADRRTLIRRVSFDLTGLLPSYQQVQEFVSDKRPDAYRRLVDRLLQSPHYGERWGRHWLDVVRFAESNGFERDRIRNNFWPYRDYVIRSFNEDKPYNQFVREQLAGDALDPDNPDYLIATGFLVAGPKNDVGTISELEKMQTRQDELDEYVTATSTTFLGLTSGCARCHAHKFDPINMKDYYGLTAVFSGLDRGDNTVATPQEKKRRATAVAAIQKKLDAIKEKADLLLEKTRRRLMAQSNNEKSNSIQPAVNFRKNIETFDPVEARFVRFTILATTDKQPCIDELELYAADMKKNLALAATEAKATASSLLPGYKIHQIAHLNDGKHGNSFSWISNEQGKGWAAIELSKAAKIQRLVWGRDRTGKINDRLATRYRIETSPDGKKWNPVSGLARRHRFDSDQGYTEDELIAGFTPAEKQQYDPLQKLIAGFENRIKKYPLLPRSYSARDSIPKTVYVLHRGDVRSRGEQVGPSAFHAVASLNSSLEVSQNDSGPNRRLQLANWIVDPKNPLTARVLVNRIWHHHFGQRIVNTQNDFGFNGDRPSHPQLLDWLATDFMKNGWRIKRMHRLIVLSLTYRQQSSMNPQALAKDGANRLLWRMSPRWLDAESIRDAILQVSGKLDLTMGGPSFRLFDYRDGNVPDYQLKKNPGPETLRRAVYRFNIRTFQSPLLSAFDCPDPSVQTPRRNTSTTALQALSLMNNPFIFKQSKEFAAQVTKTAGNDVQEQAATNSVRHEIC